jgi:hypothetical protein
MTKTKTQKAKQNQQKQQVQAFQAANLMRGVLGAVSATKASAGGTGGAGSTAGAGGSQQSAPVAGAAPGASAAPANAAGQIPPQVQSLVDRTKRDIKLEMQALQAEITSLRGMVEIAVPAEDGSDDDSPATPGGNEGKRLVFIKDSALAMCGARIVSNGGKCVDVVFTCSLAGIFADVVVDFRNRFGGLGALWQRLICLEQERGWSEVMAACTDIKAGGQDEVIVKVSERGYHPIFEAIAAFYIKMTPTQVTFGSVLVALLLTEADIASTIPSQLKMYSAQKSPMSCGKLTEVHNAIWKYAQNNFMAAACATDFFAFGTVSEAGLNRHQHAVATAGECTKCFGAHEVKSCTVKFAQ